MIWICSHRRRESGPAVLPVVLLAAYLLLAFVIV
jgi:hypothetical protein